MKSLGWKIIVLADLGASSREPVAVSAGDGWLEELGAQADVPRPKTIPGSGPLHLAFHGAGSFAPDGLRMAAGDGLRGEPLDQVLHDGAFQRVESAYRGVSFLKAHAGDAAEIEVISTPRKSLVETFRGKVFMSGAEFPPSLVIADFDFTHSVGDIAILTELCDMMKVLTSPLVVSASAEFFDFKRLAHVASLPDLASRFTDPAHLSWRSFQTKEPSRWLVMTLNRYLQRAPWEGETATDARPETFLWGRGGWLVGAAVARSVATHGHALDLSGRSGGRFAGLPSRAYPVTANETAALATEVPLDEMKAMELFRSCFTPVVGKQKSDAVILPIAVTAFRMRPGSLTVEGTLAYQLTAGRLVQFLGILLDNLPGGGAEETEAFMKQELTGFLGSMAGEAPDEVVSVKVETGASGAVANITVTPKTIVEGKPLEFQFSVPLGG
jgi:hypothetical protein